jgi:hypothetical protein
MIEHVTRAKTITAGATALAPMGQASAFPLAHTETQCIELFPCGSSRVSAAARAGGRRTRALFMKTAKPLLSLPLLPPTLLHPMLL